MLCNHWLHSFLFQSFVLYSLLLLGDCKVFEPCPPREASYKETRQLFVATCDTRREWKEFMAMRVWNVTSYGLRKKDNLQMKNVCYGENWGKHGFLTKPMIYLDYLKSLPKASPQGGKVYAILMDSDTFWSVSNLTSIWAKFDCARGEKEVVLGTEMSCWVGRYCNQEDLYRWYNGTENSPSYSPFVNSGVVMGEVTKITKMLDFVVSHADDYFIEKYKGKMKFDDQYALADYAIKVAPEDIMLDHHQQLLASCSIHAPPVPEEDGWPFVCKTIHGNISRSCVDYTTYMFRHNYFIINKEDCTAKRNLQTRLKLYDQMATLAPDPIIWHGNGVGKRIFSGLGDRSFKCFLAQRMPPVERIHARSNDE